MNAPYDNLNTGFTKTLLQISLKLEKILSFIGMIGAWCALPLIGIIIFDIISRRFFVLGSTKLQEMEWHLHAALFLLALGYAYLKNSHVRIEVIREGFSTKLKAILEIMAQQEKAWSDGNIEGFMQGYWKSDSLTYYSGGRITKGWQTTLDNYKKGYPNKDYTGTLNFTIDQIIHSFSIVVTIFVLSYVLFTIEIGVCPLTIW